MLDFFTHGRWQVREGAADEFRSEWERLAEWAFKEVPGGRWAILLRDRDNQSMFFTFGPWESLDTIADFRNRPQFQEALARMRPLLEDVQTFTLDRVASAGEI